MKTIESVDIPLPKNKIQFLLNFKPVNSILLLFILSAIWGSAFIAIKISAFNSIKDFRKKVSNLVSHVKNSRLKKGFKKILIPGDLERTNRLKNLKRGIEINYVTLSQIRELLKRRKIKIKI